MPKNASVTIEFGPYEACGIVEHRRSRLQGLETQLSNEGHQISYNEIKDWNLVRLIVNGETVYKCDINKLDYGGDGVLDSLCSEAVKCVDQAY